MKRIFFTILTCLLGSLYVSAQCPAGQTEVTIELTTAAFATEKNWDIYENGVLVTVDATGAAIPSPINGAVAVTICATDGASITVDGCDTFGDGWDGTDITITNTEDGSVNGCGAQDGCLLTSVVGLDDEIEDCDVGITPDIVSLTLGACATTPVSGCTDPTAINFNACATIDDSSCLFPPANDECVDAIALTAETGMCTGTTPGTTTNSTESLPGCVGTANDDVWFSFVATSTDQDIDITNTGGATTDIVTEVFDACGGTSIACQDTPNSPINLTGLTVGTTYYFRVYTWSATATLDSEFTVCVGSPPPPPTCADGTDPIAYCYDNNLVDEVIYEFCPTNPGETVTLDVLQGAFEVNFDNVTYYSGAAGSGTGGTILGGPVDGDQTGTTFTSNPDECIIVVANSDGSVSCISGSQDEMLVCATINPVGCAASASTISTTDPTRICIDGVGDPIDVTIDVDGGATGTWVITDAAGIILALPPMPPFDLDGAGAGQCLIWYVNSDDAAFNPMVGDDAAAAVAASSCAFLSSPITVDRIEVTAPAISTTDPTTICIDGVGDPINVNIDDAGIGANSAWVITDAAGTILALPPAPPFDLDGAGPGTCLIWLVNWEDDNFAPAVGNDAAALVAASTCAALSNPITVDRIEITAPAISTTDPTTICADDGMPDPINVSIDDAGTGGTATAWVITDAAGTILALPPGPPFDLEGAGEGTCLIWLVSTNDPGFAPVVGDDAVAAVAAATCATLSNSIAVVREINCGVCEEEITYSVNALDCDMTGAVIELMDDAGTSLGTMALGMDGGSGSFGAQPCGDYTFTIMGAPACYLDEGGEVGPVAFTTDGSGTTNQTFTTTVANIPTVGEWGLIILGLLMSITAVVGIRQRREEEVYS